MDDNQATPKGVIYLDVSDVLVLAECTALWLASILGDEDLAMTVHRQVSTQQVLARVQERLAVHRLASKPLAWFQGDRSEP